MKHLEPGPQPDDDAAPDTFAGLLENVVGGLGRVGDGEYIEQGIQLLLAARGEKLVDLSDTAPVLRVALLHVEHQGLQQIHLSVVPEVVALPIAGILNDHITEKLGHQLLPLNLGKAVPRVGGGGRDEIEHLHGVALVPEVGTAFFVELTLGVTDNQ